jgi:hypothetical protein
MLADLAAMPVSSVTLADLESYDPALLSGEQQVQFMRAGQRAESHFAGLRVTSVAGLAAPVPDTGCLDAAGLTAEVAIALRTSLGAADREIHRARGLSARLPATLAAVTAGDLTYRHASVMLSAVSHVDDRAVLAAVDPEGFERRHDQIRRDADITLEPAHDAKGYLTVYLPIDSAVTVQTALDSDARTAKAAGDARTLVSFGSPRSWHTSKEPPPPARRRVTADRSRSTSPPRRTPCSAWPKHPGRSPVSAPSPPA